MFPSSRGKKKGRWRTISLASRMGRQLVGGLMSSRLFCPDLRRRIHGRKYGHEGAAPVAGLECDLAVAECKKGMVLAHAHAFAWIEFGAALAHDHIAAYGNFATEQLDAQHL